MSIDHENLHRPRSRSEPMVSESVDNTYIQSNDEINCSPCPFTAGQIKNHIEKWKEITKNQEVLKIVCGAEIELDLDSGTLEEFNFKNTRSRSTFKAQTINTDKVNYVDFVFQCNSDKKQTVEEEITSLLQKGVIVECDHTENEIISPIFTRPKKDNKVRIILNLKEFNKSVKYQHFKMDTLNVALKLVNKGSFMASVDLRDAYYSVPIRQEDQEFLKFYWNSRLFKYTVFPNGLACCPRLFTKLLKPVLAHLHGNGNTNTMFIDDTLLIADSAAECQQNIEETVTLFTELGFVIHPTKSQLHPSKEILYLGFVINSITMTVRLTDEKKDKLIALCNSCLKSKQICIRDLAKVIGQIVASFPGVMFGPLWYRNLEECKKTALKWNKGQYDAITVISESGKEELSWWIDNVKVAYNVIDTSHGEPHLVIYTDASSIGWGCTSKNISTGGEWNSEERELNINVLELKAVLLALKIIAKELSHCHVRVMVDNTTAVSCINKMGTSHSLACNTVTKDIWIFCINKFIWLSAAHIPGKENVIADRESRNINLDTEWKLNSDLLKQALLKLDFEPNFDLFASRNNYQFKPYCSFRPDPECQAVDSFSIAWKEIKFYIFSPFCLISRVLQKIRTEEATGVIVVPHWKNQAWYPQLGKMLIRRPVKISPRKNLLSLPANPQVVHRLANSLSLLCCLVSGEDIKIKEFQKTLQIYSHRLGEEEQLKAMMVILVDGKDTLPRKVLVPFHLL